MYISVLQYLEETAEKYVDKIAFADSKGEVSFGSLKEKSMRIGCYLAKRIPRKEPVVVYMEKGVYNIVSFFGAIYAGDFYVPIDSKMPIERVKLILDTLKPRMIIFDDSTKASLDELNCKIESVYYEDALNSAIDSDLLEEIRNKSKSTDLLYVLFTSGSTGIPKGVTISHGAVIDFTEWIVEKYRFNENTKLCNQAPFYFDASIPDIYITIKAGATTYIPPSMYYTFPKKILQYIEEKSINSLIWVPSALCNVVNQRAFDVCTPDSVELVIFCGEVMPCKHLNEWRKHYPNTQFVNMYGPTEATYACMYYDINKRFDDDDVLPLGNACENSNVVLLNENNEICEIGEKGEICILGQCLSNGYYNAPDKTKDVFVQNPLNNFYTELMYRTGDLAYVDATGCMYFSGRKDYQIKRLGHRIELGEIENVFVSLKDIKSCCCIFDEETEDIVLFYVGEIEKEEVLKSISKRLPKYMVPTRINKIKQMPMNINGKIDRVRIKNNYLEEK